MTNTEKQQKLELLNSWRKNTLIDTLDITFTDVTENSITATMPVTSRVHQAFGILHGGASVALAETLGSCLSFINIDTENYYAVGTNINSNHLRAKTDGILTATASFIRKGRTLHVSQIEIIDEDGKLINHTTMTNNVIAKKS